MSLLDHMRSLVYPDLCPVCRKPCPGHLLAPGLCRQCLSAMPFVSEAERGYFWPSRQQQEMAGDERVFSAMYYQEPLRQLLIRYKFKDQPELAKILAPFMLRVMKRTCLSCDAVIAVPLHPARLRERGYYQALLLAAELARLGGYPHHSSLLLRSRNTLRQSSISDKAARTSNLQGAFSIDLAYWRLLKHQQQDLKTVWLIDDIVTTGATLEAAAESLRDLGCQVHALTMSVNLDGLSLKREKS